MIDDAFLPKSVYTAAGGASRRRSSTGVRTVKSSVDIAAAAQREKRLTEQAIAVPLKLSQAAALFQLKINLWRRVAEHVYEIRSNNYKSNYNHVKRIFEEVENKKLVAPLMLRCPGFMIILSYVASEQASERASKRANERASKRASGLNSRKGDHAKRRELLLSRSKVLLYCSAPRNAPLPVTLRSS